MKIGIGLPSHIANAPGPLTAQWARQAEHRGFDCVAAIDRLVYPSLDAVTALALAAGATERVELVTNILLAPLYPAAILAKQLAGIAAAAPDRLVVGIAPGGREDDYAAAGSDFRSRGPMLDHAINVMRETWRAGGDTALCPTPVTIPVLFGGQSVATLRRATTVGDGWAAGALRDYASQDAFATRVRERWSAAGRSGTPLLHASANFALGDDTTIDRGRDHLASYYGFDSCYAKRNTADMITSPQDARNTVDTYRDLGFDRVLIHPCVATLDQVDRLAESLL